MSCFWSSQERMESVTIQRLCQRIHLDQQLELVARLQELLISNLYFTTHTLHQHHHSAKAEEYFKQQIEDRRVVQIIRRNCYSPESFARSECGYIRQKT